MSWLTLHQCELAAHVVADTAEFLLVLAPRQDVAMTADGGKPEAVCLVQVFDPLLVDLIGATVTGERVHVPCVLLEALQILRTVVNQHILVVDMAARQQQPTERQRRGGSRCGRWTGVHSAYPYRPVRAGLPYRRGYAGRAACRRYASGWLSDQCPPRPSCRRETARNTSL
ncbi:hypothetical protein ACS6XI_09085 [Porphyromonas endodontalis]|uniref:hypothetical protein n=1 Tax=Porphyromonas endodontalis TaxID=28124 RepID=UPI003FA6E4B0